MTGLLFPAVTVAEEKWQDGCAFFANGLEFFGVDPDSGFRATTVLMHFEGPSTAAGLPEDAGIRRHRRRRAKATA